MLLRLSGGLREALGTRRRQTVDEWVPGINGREAEQLFLRATALFRSGDGETAIRLLRQATEIAPEFSDAIEAEAEALDMKGDTAVASAKYEQARRLRQVGRPGAPDRHFVLRQQGSHTAEIVAYTRVLKSLKKFALPHLARGNAYLADRQPEMALADYERTLKLHPNSLDALALKGEALSALGQFGAAIEAIDKVIAARPKDSEALNARGIAHMALGHVEQANGDWRQQLGLLGGRPAASAYVALRLADYEVALPHLETMVRNDRSDPYWEVYQRTALLRLGRPLPADVSVGGESWASSLLALQSGKASETEVMARADSPARRAEVLFQFGVAVHARDPAAARAYWQQVVDAAQPTLVEYAAARNELARSPS
ncbi:MAG: tetratricopeptide repeat protein [Reyranella sp.]